MKSGFGARIIRNLKRLAPAMPETELHRAMEAGLRDRMYAQAEKQACELSAFEKEHPKLYLLSVQAEEKLHTAGRITELYRKIRLVANGEAGISKKRIVPAIVFLKLRMGGIQPTTNQMVTLGLKKKEIARLEKMLIP